MVNMAKLAWAFDILPDSAVVDADIQTAYTDGFLVSPKEFPVRFICRSQVQKAVLMKEFEMAKAVFARYED